MSTKAERSAAAALLSAKGASLGGRARAAKLSPERRIEIARNAGLAAAVARRSRKNLSDS